MKHKKQGLKKRIITMLTLAVMTISLTGCGASLKDFVTNDLSTIMANRFIENQEILNKLYNNNLIDEAAYNIMTNNITEQSKNYRMNKDISQTLVKAVDMVRPIGELSQYDGTTEDKKFEIKDDNGKTAYKGGEALEDYVLSDHLYHNYLEWHKDMYGGEWKTRYIGKTEPVKIVDIDFLGMSALDACLNCEVWVLKSDIITADSSGGIDGIIEAVKSSMSEDGRISKVNNLAQYFEPAVYSEDFGKKGKVGDKVKLSDLVDIGSLVGVSSPNVDPNNNMPGQDLVITQYDEPILTVKIQEFNRLEIERFMSAMGIDVINGENTSKWIYYIAGRDDKNIAGTNRVYLMEYPVYYIAGMQDHKDNSNITELVLEESDLSVNILTGDMLTKKTTVSGAEVKVKVKNDKDEAYLTMNGASNFNADSQSAFMVCGTAEVNVAEDFDTGVDCSMKTGRIVLRDYLEGTYAPGFNKEQLVVFGRKIRFTNLMTEKVSYISPTQTLAESEGVTSDISNKIILVDKSKNCAVFVDKNGAVINQGNSTKLFVNNFCSVESLIASQSTIKRPTASGETECEGEGQENDSERDDTSKNLDWISTGGYVDISVEFPSEIIGKSDYITDGNKLDLTSEIEGVNIHQTFYVVATTDDVFTSNLFSTWINSDNQEASLGWWNNWLSRNQYSYTIDKTNLESYLSGNFKFELQQNGILILDLDTVMKIQKDFDKDSQANANRMVRTVARLLGVFMMFYSVILALAYVADTVADLGVKFLEKLTFGQWVAVKYDTDIPTHDAEGQQYLTFGKLCIRLIVLIGVGALLTTVDILNLVIMLMRAFGGVAQLLGELIGGLE